MKIVDKSSNIPLHTQLSAIIREMIETGELKEGDAIIPERELCNIQNVSRMTVNKTIVGLVTEGLLYRVQGKGTFVAKQKKKYQFSNVKGFTDVMKEKGVNIRTDILSFEMELPDDLVKRKLEISDNTTNIYKIIRLRYTDGEPFGLEIVYLSEEMCKGLTKGILDNSSLYRVLNEKYGYKIQKAEQVMEPIILSDEESKLLETEEGSLALKLHRNSYNKEGNPIEYTISIFRTDKYQYEIVLSE
ncbi:GntR family transcriptional regulator [Clostridioides sp. ZZV14-6154]|uniref:GntR family transcriptional regulator n=1 Tax=unclassified Clostridioides TaxID=2635829 RepID=UPI001D0FF036|nr:GntR family transcriptional regulator [Clostridioides sp. ZZV14-6154]MCC0740333.1 GntR family transcriptional regulator [Clostridioides sp. ZZV14-5902]WLD27229.1 HTH-type transcriptional repressor DasR [Clostridioides difficile]